MVSWNTADLLRRCLESLPSALEGVDASVVVVDNASMDQSAEVAASYSYVQAVKNAQNLGYARAMNQALRGAEADVLVALNPDTEPPPGSLTTLVRRLLDQPDVGLVAPRLSYPDGSLQHSAYTFPSIAQAATVSFVPVRLQRRGIGRRFWLEGFAPHNEPTDVDWVIGAVHVFRAAALDRAAPYSERWFMYVEDLDLCWRLSRAGWRRRLEADVDVLHVGGAAASQAWTSGPSLKWMPASYDWYAGAHGGAAMRAWAAVNTAGTIVGTVRGAGARVAGRPGGTERMKEHSRLVPVHAKAMIRRPRVDIENPTPAGSMAATRVHYPAPEMRRRSPDK